MTVHCLSTQSCIILSLGVYISSRNSKINTNSRIFITDIGEGDCGALFCYTDLIECCCDSDTPDGVGVLGQWLYPNGSVVGTRSDGQDFFIDRGPSVVRLNRRSSSNASSTTGLFCCEIPDATSTITKICTNVVGKLATVAVAIGFQYNYKHNYDVFRYASQTVV